MQTVVYNIILPSIGNNVEISNIADRYTVYQIENTMPPYDKIIIRNNLTGDLSRMVITNGKWQIQYYPMEHEITIIPSITPTINTQRISIPKFPNPTISNPIVSNPTFSNPTISNPIVSNPVVSNPVVSNPIVSNPVVSNPIVSDVDNDRDRDFIPRDYVLPQNPSVINPGTMYPYILIPPSRRVYGTGVIHLQNGGDVPFRIFSTSIMGGGVTALIDTMIPSYSKSISEPLLLQGDIDFYNNQIIPRFGPSAAGNYEIKITRRKNGQWIPIRYPKLNKGDYITFHNWSLT